MCTIWASVSLFRFNLNRLAGHMYYSKQIGVLVRVSQEYWISIFANLFICVRVGFLTGSGDVGSDERA